MSESVTLLHYEKIVEANEDCIATIYINRPDAANSFSPEVIEGLIDGISNASENSHCRAIIITGKGKNFSAGADLKWMQESAKLSHQENITDAGKLIRLFETIDHSPKPTIAIVNGAAYGGAVGIAACCDISIALDSAKFCLSEAKLGIIPAVILPYLYRKMMPGQLKRLALTARVFGGEEAKAFGLCQHYVSKDELQQTLKEEINLLLSTGPQAQYALKKLFAQVQEKALTQGSYTAEAIANARVGAEAQAGLGAFFEKKPTPWSLKLKEDWTFHD